MTVPNVTQQATLSDSKEVSCNAMTYSFICDLKKLFVKSKKYVKHNALNTEAKFAQY
jgi:hypothetical protein